MRDVFFDALRLKVPADNSRNYAGGYVELFGEVSLLYPPFYKEGFDLSAFSGGAVFCGDIGGQNRPPFLVYPAKVVLYGSSITELCQIKNSSSELFIHYK